MSTMTDVTDSMKKVELDVSEDDTATIVLTTDSGTVTVRGPCEVVEFDAATPPGKTKP